MKLYKFSVELLDVNMAPRELIFSHKSMYIFDENDLRNIFTKLTGDPNYYDSCTGVNHQVGQLWKYSKWDKGTFCDPLFLQECGWVITEVETMEFETNEYIKH